MTERASDLSSRFILGGDDVGKGDDDDDDARMYGTIAVEVGVSQSLPSLLRAAWVWLNQTEHQIRIVLVVKLHKPKAIEDVNLSSNWTANLKIFTMSAFILLLISIY